MTLGLTGIGGGIEVHSHQSLCLSYQPVLQCKLSVLCGQFLLLPLLVPVCQGIHRCPRVQHHAVSSHVAHAGRTRTVSGLRLVFKSWYEIVMTHVMMSHPNLLWILHAHGHSHSVGVRTQHNVLIWCREQT